MLIRDGYASDLISSHLVNEHPNFQEKLLERAVQRHLYKIGSDPAYDFRDLDESIEESFTSASPDFIDVKLLSSARNITTLTHGSGWVGTKPLFKYRGVLQWRVRLRLKTALATLDISTDVSKLIEKELTLKDYGFLNDLYLRHIQGE